MKILKPSSLDRISICVDGPAFWGWKRLRYLWNGQGCGNIRAYREEFGSALEADEVAFWMFRHNHSTVSYQKTPTAALFLLLPLLCSSFFVALLCLRV
ncbi:hypothetical protein HBI83_258820 [Parastagonospora nodorum]|nr:hypothetical protein HBI83_258820 [Parastagonospora nodorum]